MVCIVTTLLWGREVVLSPFYIERVIDLAKVTQEVWDRAGNLIRLWSPSPGALLLSAVFTFALRGKFCRGEFFLCIFLCFQQNCCYKLEYFYLYLIMEENQAIRHVNAEFWAQKWSTESERPVDAFLNILSPKDWTPWSTQGKKLYLLSIRIYDFIEETSQLINL